MLYHFVPSLRVALKTKVGRDQRGCSHEDIAMNMCTCMLTKAPGEGLGKQNLANQSEQRQKENKK